MQLRYKTSTNINLIYGFGYAIIPEGEGKEISSLEYTNNSFDKVYQADEKFILASKQYADSLSEEMKECPDICKPYKPDANLKAAP